MHSRRTVPIHEQIADLLGHPRFGRVGRHTGQMHRASAELDEQQDVEPSQEHRVDGEEIAGQDRGGLGGEELAPRWAHPTRRRIESSPLQVCHTVEGATRCPSPASSLWMCRYPQPGLSVAKRSTSSRTTCAVGGRPGGVVAADVHLRATSSRCQRSSVLSCPKNTGQRSRGSPADTRPARPGRPGAVADGGPGGAAH